MLRRTAHLLHTAVSGTDRVGNPKGRHREDHGEGGDPYQVYALHVPSSLVIGTIHSPNLKDWE
jgi:hypothetical protein